MRSKILSEKGSFVQARAALAEFGLGNQAIDHVRAISLGCTALEVKPGAAAYSGDEKGHDVYDTIVDSIRLSKNIVSFETPEKKDGYFSSYRGGRAMEMGPTVVCSINIP